MTVPAVPAAAEVPAAERLAACVEAFRRYMYLPEPGSIHMALATCVANRMPGDPVWTLLVGPPSSGKTEPVRAVALSELDCHMVGTITEAGLLSATPKKQHAAGARGGLLREIGEFGILVAKDFTSVLSMHRDARAALLAALREIYDGSWTRIAGSDGGKRYDWSGKLGFLGGVTGAIDSAHAVMGMMGERFLLYRLSEQTAADQARAALSRAGDAEAMRAELAEAMGAVLRAASDDAPPRELTRAEVDWLAALAELACRARSAVERDGYSREITLIPDAEAPARLAITLRQLLCALEAIGAPEPHATVRSAALDSVPCIRRHVMEGLASAERLGTGEMAERLGYPTGTTRRSLEELTAHGLVWRVRGAGSRGDTWHLTERARELWKDAHGLLSRNVTQAEKPYISSLLIDDDKTGMQSGDGR